MGAAKSWLAGGDRQLPWQERQSEEVVVIGERQQAARQATDEALPGDWAT